MNSQIDIDCVFLRQVSPRHTALRHTTPQSNKQNKHQNCSNSIDCAHRAKSSRFEEITETETQTENQREPRKLRFS